MEETDKLLSVGYKTIVINERNINPNGDILLSVQLSISLDKEEAHTLSSDLGSLLTTGEVSDLIVEAGEKQFRVHKNILAHRSPVFAQLIDTLEDQQEEDNTGAPVCHSIVEETEEDIAQTSNTDDLNIQADDTRDNDDYTKEERCELGCDENLLQTQSEKSPEMKKLVITDIEPDTVGHILRYIYTDSLDDIDTVSPDLLAGSDLYQVL